MRTANQDAYERLTPSQYRFFKRADEEYQHCILRALDRVPVMKRLKNGMFLKVLYVYTSGTLKLDAQIWEQGKIVWKKTYTLDDAGRNLDGNESDSLIIKTALELLIDDIWADGKKNVGLLKKILM